jgi:hypothetical protein
MTTSPAIVPNWAGENELNDYEAALASNTSARLVPHRNTKLLSNCNGPFPIGNDGRNPPAINRKLLQAGVFVGFPSNWQKSDRSLDLSRRLRQDHQREKAPSRAVGSPVQLCRRTCDNFWSETADGYPTNLIWRHLWRQSHDTYE